MVKIHLKKRLREVKRKARNYLSRGFAADEFVEDLLGFGGQFGGGFGISVILAGKVERNVLLAELGHQEGGEGTQSIWGERERKCDYTCVRGGNKSVWLSAGARERLRAVLFCQWGGKYWVQSIPLTFAGQEFLKGLFPSEAFFQGWPEKQTKSISLGSDF